MRSVLQLMDVHAGLHELLAIHRDHVVGLEFKVAMDALERFEQELRDHMAIEDPDLSSDRQASTKEMDRAANPDDWNEMC